MTVRRRLTAMDDVRSPRPRLPGHGAITQHIVSPCRHKSGVPKRYRAVSLLDDRLEHVIRFAIKHNGRVRIRLDVDLVELLFSTLDQRSQFVRRQWELQPVLEPMACAHVAKQEVADLGRPLLIDLAHFDPLCAREEPGPGIVKVQFPLTLPRHSPPLAGHRAFAMKDVTPRLFQLVMSGTALSSFLQMAAKNLGSLASAVMTAAASGSIRMPHKSIPEPCAKSSSSWAKFR